MIKARTLLVSVIAASLVSCATPTPATVPTPSVATDGPSTGTIPYKGRKVEIYQATSVPPNWPSDVPTPPNSDVVGVGQLNLQEGGSSAVITYVVFSQSAPGQSADQVQAAYAQSLNAQGWSTQTDDVTTYTKDNPTRSVAFAVKTTPRPDQYEVVVSFIQPTV